VGVRDKAATAIWACRVREALVASALKFSVGEEIVIAVGVTVGVLVRVAVTGGTGVTVCEGVTN